MDYPMGNITVRRLQTVPCDMLVDDVIDIVQQDGAVILDRVLSDHQVAAINAEIDAARVSEPACAAASDELGGHPAHVADLVSLSGTFRDAFLDQDNIHALILALFDDGSDGMWLSSSEAIDSSPGDKALPLERNLYHYPIFLPLGPQAAEVTCALYVALSDTTAKSGAVRLIPESHKWDFCEPYHHTMTIPVPLKAGSVLFCSGKLVHGIGSNLTHDTSQRLAVASFNIAPLVPLDAHPFRVPVGLSQRMSLRLRQMLGFLPFRLRGSKTSLMWRHETPQKFSQ